jgi:hypothetical protein
MLVANDYMANPEQVKVLRQGVEAWNKWRLRNPEIIPDLIEADLLEANLSLATLCGAKLNGARLSDADLNGADLRRADLTHANLSRAKLSEAVLSAAKLSGAKLGEADLFRADLSGADLSGADLSGADLSLATLCVAKLSKADLSEAHFGSTVLVNTDLSEVKGLEAVIHHGPSSIGIDTFFLSRGKIPEVFLRGAGVPDSFIQYAASLVGMPFELNHYFISHSSKDKALAERLYADLQGKGVRCYYAPEDLKTGAKQRVELDEAIRGCKKLLLLLSEHSVKSDWVEKEVETAFEQERKRGHTVLLPIRLDEAVMEIQSGWPADIRRTRNIGDFTKWKDPDAYQKAFDRLLRDLKVEKVVEMVKPNTTT